MQLNDNEFGIGVLENDGSLKDAIIITKEALEEWRVHYRTISSEKLEDDRRDMYLFYGGKADVLTDILKHFEEE